MRTAAAKQLRSKAERNALVEQYLPLVKYVVGRLPVTMPATLDRDDFFSVGVIGLMHAASNFDPTRGASFKTFAYTAIRGAILDEIRKHDPVPRSRRDRLRRTEQARVELRAKLGTEPTLEEIAAALDVTAEELDQDLLTLYTARTLSLDEHAGSSDMSLANIIEGTSSDPSAVAMQHELVAELAKHISTLPDADRHVLVLYHYEGLFLKEIGSILGVSESRVSQILSRATERLRLKMKPQESEEESEDL